MSFNLLNAALRIIPKQRIIWRKFTGYAVDGQGLRINQYDAGKELFGSVQAVDRSLYDQLGLDQEKEYLTVYAPADIKGVSAQNAPDIIEFGGAAYKVVRNYPWYFYNGWAGVVVVKADNGEFSGPGFSVRE